MKSDDIFTLAGIPKIFWNLTREVTPEFPGKDVIIDFIDSLDYNVDYGLGISIVGVPRSGKTLCGAAIMKAALAFVRPGSRFNYSAFRICYDSLQVQTDNKFSDHTELRNSITTTDVFFLDQIGRTNPNIFTMDVMRARKDRGVTTILAFDDFGSNVKNIYEMFSDVNKTVKLSKEIKLPDARVSKHGS